MTSEQITLKLNYSIEGITIRLDSLREEFMLQQFMIVENNSNLRQLEESNLERVQVQER